MSEVLVKIKGSAKSLVDACKRGITSSKQAAKEIKKQFKEAQQAAGGVGGKGVGQIGNALGVGAAGPMAAGVAAGAAVVNLANKIYEQYKNVQAAAVKEAEALSKAATEQTSRVDALTTARRAAAEALDKFAGLEKLTNVQTLEATTLIETLNKSYDGLGLTIDDVTQRTEKYINAREKMAEKDKTDKVSAMKSELNALIEEQKKWQERQNDALSVGFDAGGTRVGWGGDDAAFKEAADKVDELGDRIMKLKIALAKLNATDPAGDVRDRLEAEKKDLEEKKKAEEQKQKEAEDKRKADAQKAEEDAAKRRAEAVESVVEAEKRETEYIEMRRKGLLRELAIRKAIDAAIRANGGQELTDQQRADVEAAAGAKFDAEKAAEDQRQQEAEAQRQQDAAQQANEQAKAKMQDVIAYFNGDNRRGVNPLAPEQTHSLQNVGALSGVNINKDTYAQKTATATQGTYDTVRDILRKLSSSSNSKTTSTFP